MIRKAFCWAPSLALIVLTISFARTPAARAQASVQSSPASDHAQTINFNVAAQSATTGILEFARQAGIQILVSEPLVRGKTIMAVSGSHPIDEALAILLKGTGLTAISTDGTTYTLSVAAKRSMLPNSDPRSSPSAQSLGEPSAVNPATGAGGELEEVVVSAQRRSEKLQDVPISVEAFSANDLSAAGVTGTADLPILTPGFVFGSQAGVAQPFLRGIGTVASGASNENPVAFYVDNVYYAAAISGILAFNNIDQIEVDKGPQGTLFGRNATGGLIQVTTKIPSDTFGGTISATYGNYATAGTDFYVTGGLANNLDADLALHFQHQGDGYGVNVLTGEAVGQTQDLAMRNKWLLTIPDGTKIILILDYGVTHFVPNYTAAPGTTALGAPAIPLSSQDVIGHFQPFGDTHQGGASLHVDHDFDGARFLSITAYRRSAIAASGSAQLTPDPEFSIGTYGYQKNAQITQEFQVQSLPSSRISWTAGTFLYSDNSGETPPTTVLGGLVTPLAYLDIYDHQKTYSAALYGQATGEVASATNLTVGLRYSVERRDIRGYEGLGFPDGTSLITPDAEHKIFDKPTWRFAIDHHFSQDVMSYVSYNRGFKSGGFNDALFPTVEFSPEVLDAYELGEKTTLFDRHLSLNASAFFYNYKNIQALQYFENGSAYIYNAGAARLYGVDFDAKLKLSESFSVTAGMEGLHTGYTSFPNAALSEPAPGGGTIYSFGSAKGNHLPFSPAATLSLTGDYIIPLASLGELTLSATYSYNAGFFGEPDNRLHQPAYHVVNAQVAWNSPDKIYTVKGWGRNLTNSDYVSALGSQPNGDFAVFNPPRTYGLTISRNF